MLSVPHERCVHCLKAPAYAGVRGQTTSDQPTKHSSASVPSVVFRHKTLCFLFIPPSRRAGCFFLPSEVADILPSSLFDKQKGFKDLFHPFNIYTPEGDNEFNGLACAQTVQTHKFKKKVDLGKAEILNKCKTVLI